MCSEKKTVIAKKCHCCFLSGRNAQGEGEGKKIAGAKHFGDTMEGDSKQKKDEKLENWKT